MLYKIKITPESFSQIIKHVDYNGKEIGVYRTVSEVLTGTTNNQPIISAFNIPILLKQNSLFLVYVYVLSDNSLKVFFFLLFS
jgi:hypothetical protein